jgi:hypothetical protein
MLVLTHKPPFPLIAFAEVTFRIEREFLGLGSVASIPLGYTI